MLECSLVIYVSRSCLDASHFLHNDACMYVYHHRCGITIMIAMPLNLLPCREALLEVVDVWFHYSHHRADQEGSNPEEQGCWRLFHRLNSTEDVEGKYQVFINSLDV